MKYIVGILIGLSLTAGIAYAKKSGMEHVNSIDLPSYTEVYKVYDNDNKVVCYVSRAGNSGGISCVK